MTRVETDVALYEDKARAELLSADALVPGADRVAWAGDVLGVVALVKGQPGAADVAAGRALAGDDGEAIAKALHALGFDPALAFATVSRPVESPDDACAARLRRQIEAVDPRAVVALDAQAADDLGAAFEIVLRPGAPVRVSGRMLVALDDFEASLADEQRKRQVWGQLQALAGGAPRG